MAKNRAGEAAAHEAGIFPYGTGLVPLTALTSCPDCGAPGLVYVRWWNGDPAYEGYVGYDKVFLIGTRAVAGFSHPETWAREAQDKALAETGCVHQCAAADA